MIDEFPKEEKLHTSCGVRSSTHCVPPSISELRKGFPLKLEIVFFARACFLALIYVFFSVPEIAGLIVEEIDNLFRGPWFNAYKRSRRPVGINES